MHFRLLEVIRGYYRLLQVIKVSRVIKVIRIIKSYSISVIRANSTSHYGIIALEINSSDNKLHMPVHTYMITYNTFPDTRASATLPPPTRSLSN